MRGLVLVSAQMLAAGALAPLIACHDGAGVASGPPAPAAAAPAPAAASGPAGAQASAAYYTAELKPGAEGCVHGQPCRATVHLAAVGKYHLNEEYPFRFVPDAAPGVTFGAERPLVRDDTQHGTLVVEFTPASAGAFHLGGTFKLSVCSESACQIERPRLGVEVAVK